MKTIIGCLAICAPLIVFFWLLAYIALPAKTQIICVGDSITKGVGSSDGFGYRSRLKYMLGKRYTFVNDSFSGRTSEQVLKTLPLLLSETEGMKRIFLLTIGTNDRYQGVSEEEIQSNITRIRQLITLNEGIVIEVNPINSPAFLDDNVHPNDEGYNLMARMAYLAIKAIGG